LPSLSDQYSRRFSRGAEFKVYLKISHGFSLNDTDFQFNTPEFEFNFFFAKLIGIPTLIPVALSLLSI